MTRFKPIFKNDEERKRYYELKRSVVYSIDMPHFVIPEVPCEKVFNGQKTSTYYQVNSKGGIYHKHSFLGGYNSGYPYFRPYWEKSQYPNNSETGTGKIIFGGTYDVWKEALTVFKEENNPKLTYKYPDEDPNFLAEDKNRVFKDLKSRIYHKDDKVVEFANNKRQRIKVNFTRGSVIYPSNMFPKAYYFATYQRLMDYLNKNGFSIELKSN
ncbi:MAG: hypothetical protein RJQ00_09745 [Vicingaceae bacterium]